MEIKEGTLGIDSIGNICVFRNGSWRWWAGDPDCISEERMKELVRIKGRTNA